MCIIANTHFAYAQTASILPQGKTQFTDNNGKPLASGTVDFYIPSTSTRKTTWQNSGETIANTNPVVLDGGGRAIIYGDGSYRMVVKDRLGNLIYDQLTSSTGSGSTPSTSTGDGDLVGTIKPWAGMTAPSQYLFTYGQEVSRTTYSALYTAITSTQAVFCNSGSPTLTGVGDTTNFWVGMSLEISCVIGGFSTIVSKTASSITMAANSNVSTNTTATFFPWGRGNGSTTFNLPDLRGTVLAGNNNMGGVASSNLTTTYFGATNPNSIGALGGGQSNTLAAVNVPSHLHSIFLNDPGHFHTTTALNGAGGVVVAGGAGFNPAVPTNSDTKTTGITIRDTSGGFGTTNQTTPVGGGIAVSATLGNTGSGYTNGSQTITIAGGTCTTQPQFTVTISGNVFTGTPALLTAGSCTIAPTNPAATTGGGGTGGTLNVSYSAQPFSIIPPTRTTNYIIKVTPDANSATASGVTAIQGMTGSIGCVGTAITCTGNNITVNIPTSLDVIVGSTGILSGTAWGVIYNNNGLVGNTAAGTSGYALMGNGSSAPTFQGFVPSVTGAITRTWNNKIKEIISITDFAVCDSSTDNTTAIQNFINSVPSTGAQVYIPSTSGNCLFSGTISSNGKNYVRFYGNGTVSNSVVSSSLVYTGSGARAFDLRDSVGWVFENFSLTATNNAFSGTLIDCGGNASVSFYCSLMQMTLNGNSTNTPTCLDLSKSIEAVVEQSNFNACNIGILGQQTLGQSTVAHIHGNQFYHSQTMSISDCGEAWNIYANTFENLASGAAGAFSNNSARPCKGLVYNGNWHGDANGTGTWITVTAEGAHFSGGRIANGAVGIAMVGGDNYNFDGLIIESTTAFTCSSSPTGRFGKNNTASATTVISGTCGNFDWTGLQTNIPSTKTTNYTQTIADRYLIFNNSGGSSTLTTLSAASFPGLSLEVKTTQAQTVVSASSNVIPLAGGAAGTAILAATAGKWGKLVSDGSNWVLMSGN